MRRILLLVGGLSLVSLAAAAPIQQFVDRTRPAPYIAREPEPPPALGDCRLGPLDTSRARFWSFALELDVQRTVIESRFIWHVSGTTARPLGIPETILLDDRILPSRHEDSWTMNEACSSLAALRRSTAASYRRVNRTPDDRVSRWLSLQVPIAYRRLPISTDWPDFMRIDPDRVGILRLSRVGFSDDGSQALIALGRYYASGRSEGFYYLLERRGSSWRIMDEAIIWQV